METERPSVLSAPVDIAWLAAFRILFGALLAAATIRFMALGWVEELYVRPRFHLTWDAFAWVQPWPGSLMHVHFAVLAILALGIAAGFFYRLCTALFLLAFAYVEVLDKANYLNHYYLVTLLVGLLLVFPAHRAWSLDVWRRPRLATATVPVWTLYLLRFQIGVVYVFAGLAKLNGDWLLDAQPLRIWLAARSDLPVIGDLLSSVGMAYAFSWFGAAYDLSIVLFLLWGQTRRLAYATVILFHVMTWLLFPIGMFPWVMIVATLVFFPPDWPRRWIGQAEVQRRDTRPRQGVIARPLLGSLVLYAALQIVVPLRSYWPGTDPNWTGRGFNFAWRVMLVEKAGYAEFVAHDRATGASWVVPARDYLTERQERMMATDPFMVRALARHIAADLKARGFGDVEVLVESFATLNGRPAQRLIDPEINLAGRTPKDWILPRERKETRRAQTL